MNNPMFLFGGEGGMNPIFLIVLVAIFAVIMIIPMVKNKKQEKKDAQMRDELQPGDEVTTIGGIIGKVVSVKGETFVLETTKDKTKIRFLKGAIRSVDVKAQDIAAQILDTKQNTAKDAANDAAKKAAAPVPKKEEKKKRGKKHREAAEKAKAEDAENK